MEIQISNKSYKAHCQWNDPRILNRLRTARFVLCDLRRISQHAYATMYFHVDRASTVLTPDETGCERSWMNCNLQRKWLTSDTGFIFFATIDSLQTWLKELLRGAEPGFQCKGSVPRCLDSYTLIQKWEFSSTLQNLGFRTLNIQRLKAVCLLSCLGCCCGRGTIEGKS